MNSKYDPVKSNIRKLDQIFKTPLSILKLHQNLFVLLEYLDNRFCPSLEKLTYLEAL